MMTIVFQFRRIVIASALFLVFSISIDSPASAAETQEVKARDLTLNVPKTWKEEKPKSRLRVTQFRVPAAEGDKEDAELAVFNFGGGGGFEANIRRWIGQFQQKDRKVKITSGVSTQGKYVLVDLSGTYNKPDGPPFARKTKPVPGSRMLSVILVVKKKGVYYLKLTGLEKTVRAQAGAFRASFGSSADKEKAYELSE